MRYARSTPIDCPTPYNIPVDRATLDLDKFLSDFQTKYSIDSDCMIRLSGKLAELTSGYEKESR